MENWETDLVLMWTKRTKKKKKTSKKKKERIEKKNENKSHNSSHNHGSVCNNPVATRKYLMEV